MWYMWQTLNNGLSLTYSGTSVLRKTSTALQLAIQFTFGRKLQDEIHTRRVVKVTIETEDIGMPVGQRCREVFREIQMKHLTDI